MKKSLSTDTEKHGRWLPWAAGTLAFAGLAGTLFALSEVLENDFDGDGWTDAEEIIAGTDPADETDPWDSDGDGIADYLEFADGTDPLDPNDPPRARGASTAYGVAATTNETTEGGDTSTPDTNTPIFPALEEASRQSMYHATAWYNGRVDLAFITPTATSKWQAAVGTELEYWNVGYYDLLARNNSKGIAITLNALPAQKYALCWKHMKRPDNGETGYSVSVKIGEEVIASQSFTAPERTQAEGGEDVSLNFTLAQGGLDNVTIVFMPTGTSTSGPLVGSIALREAITVSEVNLNAGDGGTEFSVTQDSGAAFTGSDWVLSRTRQANPVAFQSGSKLKLVPTFRLPDSTVPARIQAQVPLGNSTNTYTLAWSERGNGIEIPAPVPAGTVGYFENATIVWKVSYDANSDTWEDVGTSTHEIYFTRAAPQAGLAQETLFWVACSACHGKSTNEDIIDGIWSKFSTGSGPTNLCRRDGTPMKYWGEEALWRSHIYSSLDAQAKMNPANEELEQKQRDASTGVLDSAQELIAYADGQCGAWSKFLHAAFLLNDIAGIEFGIVPESSDDAGFLIKNYEARDPIDPTTQIDGDYKYVTYMSESEFLEYTSLYCYVLMDLPGIEGQNNSDPHSAFNDHGLVYCEGSLYDPSYGQRGEKVNDINLAIRNWAKSYIAAFQHFSMVRKYELINGSTQSRSACRLYDEAKAGVKISNQ